MTLTPEQRRQIEEGTRIHAMRSTLRRIAEHPLSADDKQAMAQAAVNFQVWAREALK